MRVLVAIDGSPCSDAAVTEISSRPWPVGSEFKVLTAYELPPTPTPDVWAISSDYYEKVEEVVRENAQAVAEGARLKLREKLDGSFIVSAETIAGSPRNVILKEADSWKADLIVVGSHGYSRWERFLLGSVSQAVVSHAKCSVEVVRCKSAEAEVEAA